MKTANLFQNKGKWYRGNLHMHTTRSDGMLEPEQAIKLYREAGYDFLALTDHRKPSQEYQEKDFLLLPGVEWDTGDNQSAPVFHIIGIGMTKPCSVDYKDGVCTDPQKLIDAVREAGGLAILAHPAWSVMNPADIEKLSGLAGAEIYNSVSTLPMNGRRADSSLYFDLWASEGRAIPCMAADDSHRYQGEETKSWIMVNAQELSSEAICRAIEEKNFYATQGPRFEQITFDQETGEMTVHCSPDVQSVVFYSNAAWADGRVEQPENGRVTYVISPLDRYLRVELIDEAGRMAWSSPVLLTR